MSTEWNPRDKKIATSFALLIVFFFFLFTIAQKPYSKNIKQVKIAGQIIKVELALTKEAQEQGLSSRSELKVNEGMLFVFDHPDKYFFWMKNMNFAIDIIWIAPDMKVIYIKKNAEPEVFLETYGPDKEAKYVLEVVPGFSEKNNLKEGDSVLFTY